MMTSTLHTNASQASNRHLDSMMASLARRLEVARANNNFLLVKLLEQEKQQLASPATPEQLQSNSWLENFRHKVAVLLGSSKVQVHQFINGSDRWWYAVDPKTGHFIYADSEAELRLLLKQDYYGN